MHQIRQHIIDMNCSSESFGNEVNANLSSVLEKEFYPKLEMILNRYSEENQIWLIDNLEIEISEISEKYWKEEIVNKSLEHIENFLRLNKLENSRSENSDKKSNSGKLSIGNYAENLLMEFLKSGRIVENSKFTDINSVIVEIKISEIFYYKILEIFKDQNQTILRWIYSVPIDFRNELYQFMNVQNKYSDIENVLKINNYEEKRRFSELMMLISLNEIIISENVFEFLNQSAKKYWNLEKTEILEFLNSKQVLTEKELNFIEKWKNNLESESKNFEIKENKTQKEEFIYVENSGLTILHPFFTSLFEQLNLTDKNEWKCETESHKAVLLMHFLVYGDEIFEEDKMVLNKNLCGLPSDEVINVNIPLNDEEKEACKDLLKAVIQHWSVMNKSSIQALRETFLQRNGKLEFKNENLELWIEVKGVDILLDQIPWGISTIKTPWMEHILFCHWNH
ncbi:contractile injection system tape measure protein [Chryseobacterium caseinilyticum]|uniref:Uncharacterized protein n=1 Tax=Chryseobacterium caseinilyticum TaxID=2771428 RepID=A0ABR8ZAN8_9FLAO|nr:contractile injection system tape measure protein [Chryseobacterium caseinilyticum]MBD8082296.1 hypothetical protein [Chryseobacterium caseinilyticum]